MVEMKETGTELMKPGFYSERSRQEGNEIVVEGTVPATWGDPVKESFRQSIREFFNSFAEIWVESGKAWDARQAERREAKLASQPPTSKQP